MKTEILQINPESIQKAKEILEAGGVVAIPTETVYGLGAIGTDGSAVKKIFEVKGRPNDNPLIAHIHKDYDIENLAFIEQDYVKDLIKAYMPGPLTIVLKSKKVICNEAVCGGETIAIRMPIHEGCQRLLKAVDKPIVAPSANLSKHTSPVTATHVYDDLNGLIPLILDGGKCSGGIESTVLDVTEKVPRILRAGLVTKEMIEKITGECQIAEHKPTDSVRSPGVLYKHYRPKCQTALFAETEIEQIKKLYAEWQDKGKKPYIICADWVAEQLPEYNILRLGNSGEEIASNLYDKLLEGEKIADILIAVAIPRDDGVFMGIMNRFSKSCG